MTLVGYVSAAAATRDLMVGVGMPLYPVDYAISLDRPRFQMLGTLHAVNRATKRRAADDERAREGNIV